MAQTTVRVHDQSLRWQDFERLVKPVCDHLGGFDVVALHVDDARAELETVGVTAEELEVVEALAAELQNELIDAGVENRGEEKVIVTLPRRPGVAIPVTDVERDVGVDVFGDDVHRRDREVDLIWVPGEVRLVELDATGFGRHEPER